METYLSEGEVRKALDQVKHPAIDLTLVELGIVKEVSVIGNSVTITLAFPSAGIPIENRLINSVREPVEELGGEVEVKTTLMNPEEVQKFLAMEQEAWKGL
ncbi:MAG: iron-sulfur cluster assembly protein [Candidatus Euphemobacter frigidus]|nr:iron-sulfur cluster assembly protein [Candidatus Euphemobacter frigidus]